MYSQTLFGMFGSGDSGEAMGKEKEVHSIANFPFLSSVFSLLTMAWPRN